MKEVLQMMLLTKPKLATVLLATVGVMGVLAASFFAPMHAADEQPAEPKPAPAPAAKTTLATKITFRENDIGDVATLLRIEKKVCEVELQPQKPHTLFGVDIEVYKDGRKAKTYVTGAVGSHKAIRAKVALLAADSDYLPLAGARAKHCRMKITFGVYSDTGHATNSNEIDVPKKLFDLSHDNSFGNFSPDAGSATEMPLFYLHVNRSNQTVREGHGTVPELIKNNPKEDFLIVYLRVRKE